MIEPNICGSHLQTESLAQVLDEWQEWMYQAEELCESIQSFYSNDDWIRNVDKMITDLDELEANTLDHVNEYDSASIIGEVFCAPNRWLKARGPTRLWQMSQKPSAGYKAGDRVGEGR